MSPAQYLQAGVGGWAECPKGVANLEAVRTPLGWGGGGEAGGEEEVPCSWAGIGTREEPSSLEAEHTLAQAD